MEPFPLYLIEGLFLLIVFIAQVLFYKHKSPFSYPNLPPGRIGWPILGESLDFLSTGWKGHPERFIHDRMIKYNAECFKTSILAQPMAVLCGPSGNKFLYSNENKLVTSWWPDSVDKVFSFSQQTSSKVESKKLRNLLPQFLEPRALQMYIGIMDTITQQHFTSAWENKEEILVFPLAKSYTFLLACRLFISVEDTDHIARFAEPFNRVTAGILSMPINLPGTPLNKAIKASKFIRQELMEIIKQRKVDLAKKIAAPNQDILSHMLSVSNESGECMSDVDIANKILGLLIGGHDTTSAAITFIIKYLAELSHVYDAVYKEQMEIAKSKEPGEMLNWEDIGKMKYSWSVACEVLRLNPPLQGAFREAITCFTYGGYNIPKGWKLYWSTHSTHRDPKYFPDPEKFDPERFQGEGPAPYTFVPFGGGPRMCPGKEYARLEMLVFMHNLVKRFRWEKLIPDEKIIVDPLPMPAKGLPIRLIPHNNTEN